MAGRRIKATRDTLIKALQGDWRAEHLFALRHARATYAHYRQRSRHQSGRKPLRHAVVVPQPIVPGPALPPYAGAPGYSAGDHWDRATKRARSIYHLITRAWPTTTTSSPTRSPKTCDDLNADFEGKHVPSATSLFQRPFDYCFSGRFPITLRVAFEYFPLRQNPESPAKLSLRYLLLVLISLDRVLPVTSPSTPDRED